MGGGLLQLVAHGAQDAYLTTNPQITFWKGLYKRHTNFAMEPFRINLTGMPQWGAKQSATIGRHADLISKTYLEVVLPATKIVSGTSSPVNWNNEQGRLGYMLLSYVDLEIGGQLIDRQYSEWMYLWETLSSDKNTSYKSWQTIGAGREAGSITLTPPSGCSAKTGRQSHPNVVFVPLNFFYTKTPGLALPLIALQYHDVKVNLQWNTSQFVAGDWNEASTLPAPTAAALYVDYIYLDVDERRRMAQESHEYLIEQVQFNQDKGVSSANARIDLTFNHPVKELVWVVQPERFTNCKIAGKVHTGADGVPRPGIGQAPAADDRRRITPFTYSYLNANSPNSAAAFTQPVLEQWIQFNGQDRLDKRYGDYYNKVQPLQFHTGTMAPDGFDNTAYTGTNPSRHQAVYSYSFAVKPEEHQPSGTCNFSRIDTATLVVNMSGDYIVDESTDNSWNVRVYAINYNVLRVMSGMAGLAYSN